MNRTLHFKFPLYNNNDKPSILNDYNSTISEIDRVLYALSIATGSSDEYEQKLDELQQDLIELTTIVDEHGKDLTEISQTIATILGSVAALSTKVDGYDDRINNINTRLNNAFISISKKFDTRSENDLPSQPIYDSDNNVYYVKVPYCPTTQDDTSFPQELTPYGMNSQGFIWYGWRIIEFRIYKDNDESKELLSTVSLSPNDMVRAGFMKQMTLVYDEETETDVELWFWILNFSPIISVQTTIDNSTYTKVNAPYNGRITLSTVVKGRMGQVRTVWFNNPCTVYWRNSQNEIVEVEVAPYKLYTCLLDYGSGDGVVQEVYGNDGGSGGVRVVTELSTENDGSYSDGDVVLYAPQGVGSNGVKGGLYQARIFDPSEPIDFELINPSAMGKANLNWGNGGTIPVMFEYRNEQTSTSEFRRYNVQSMINSDPILTDRYFVPAVEWSGSFSLNLNFSSNNSIRRFDPTAWSFSMPIVANAKVVIYQRDVISGYNTPIATLEPTNMQFRISHEEYSWADTWSASVYVEFDANQYTAQLNQDTYAVAEIGYSSIKLKPNDYTVVN